MKNINFTLKLSYDDTTEMHILHITQGEELVHYEAEYDMAIVWEKYNKKVDEITEYASGTITTTIEIGE